jgi:peptidoglycan biosynthesis protein MviN/MurJ (putative lipid II flippase)
MAALMCPIVASAPAAIPLVFGDAWAGVAEILPGAGLALVMGAPISAVLLGLLYARNDANTALVASVVDAVTRLAVTFALLPAIGASAIGIGWAASVLVQMTITLRGVRRLIDAHLATCIGLPCLVACVAAAAGWLVAETLGRSVVSILASGATAGLGFLLLLGIFAPRHARRAVTMVRSVYRTARRQPVVVT